MRDRSPQSIAEDVIRHDLAKACDSEWTERNRGAMASYDAFVERDGLLLDDLRVF
jgi:post-segregation antitoxin (ccd killing protein)